MRITQIETICLSRMHEPERQWITAHRRIVKADAAIVVIQTDMGVTGIGEASPYGGPFLIRDWVRWLAQDMLGRDPNENNLIPTPDGRMVTGDFPHLSPYDCAIAGIDTALWDLRGKLAGKRVCDVITSQASGFVRVYASGGVRYDWSAHPESLIEEVLDYRQQGFTAAKVRIGTEWQWNGVTVDQFLGLMRELAQAVNGSIELMVDGNGRLSFAQALPIARELAQLGFTWFEEPMPMSQIDDYCALTQAGEIAISGGEGFTTVAQFRPYLERHAISIAQPDVACCGMTEALRIARMAAHYGITIIPHNWHNGLMTMANAHFVAATPNARLLEICMVQGPLQRAILATPPAIHDGQLDLSQLPGLGVALADELERRFPYIEGHYSIQVVR